MGPQILLNEAATVSDTRSSVENDTDGLYLMAETTEPRSGRGDIASRRDGVGRRSRNRQPKRWPPRRGPGACRRLSVGAGSQLAGVGRPRGMQTRRDAEDYDDYDEL